MKQSWRLALLVIGFVLAGATAPFWVSPLLGFISLNTDLIQGLTDLVQLILWGVAGIGALIGLFRATQSKPPPAQLKEEKTEDRSVTVEGSAVQSVIVPGTGNVIHLTLPAGEQPRPAVDPALLEAGYLRRLQVVCNALPLAVIDPHALERNRQQTMDLAPIYVALYTRTQVPVDEKRDREKRSKGKGGSLLGGMTGERETRPLPALEAAVRDRCLVLLGDPGSGKSTFANHLALCLAGARLARLEKSGAETEWLSRLQPVWTLDLLLPVRVTLRHFAASPRCDGTANGLWGFIEDALAAEGLADYAPHLRQHLLNGGVLLILDGLDEVADPGQRQSVRDAVASFAATYSNNRYLVTCRVYAYQDPCCQLDRFTTHTLAPFNPEQIDNFIRHWYEEVCRLGWKDKSEADGLTDRLQAAVRRPDLAPLAQNPLQLTMMASLHFSWGRLPDDRVELYQEMVRLLLVRWQEARLGQETGVTQTLSAGKLESALERVAFIAHNAQKEATGPADISETLLRSVFKDYLEGSWDRAGQLVAYIQERAGLLLWRGPELYSFPHRSYQEYLAGCHLAVQPDFPDQAASLVRANYAQWREAVLWAVGVMARLKKMIHVAVDVAAALCPRPLPPATTAVSETDWRAAVLAGESLIEIGVPEVAGRERHAPVLAHVRDWLAALLERDALTPTERAAAGNALGVLGDPRPGVGLTPQPPSLLEGGAAVSPLCVGLSPIGGEGPGLALSRSEGVRLPDILCCEIPAGPFLMGTRPEEIPALTQAFSKPDWYRYEWETPQHEVNLPTYYIARYPVTQAQFAAFVAAGGYQEQSYWPEAVAAGLWREGKIKRWYPRQVEGEWRAVEEEADAPADYGEPFSLPNHPVVGVCWYEAMAFCRWLEAQLKKSANQQGGRWVSLPVWHNGRVETCRLADFQIRLPTEAEWEKAARGRDGRRFPWGDAPEPGRANDDATGIGATSAVGAFPGGASLSEVLDLSGNVWEWTRSLWGEWKQEWGKGGEPTFRYPYRGDDGREDETAGPQVLRVVRGGSFYNNLMWQRCAVRSWYNPLNWYVHIGFRFVVAPGFS